MNSSLDSTNEKNHPIVDVDVVDELIKCPPDYCGSAIWWTRLAQSLDDLRDQLITCNVRDFSRKFVEVAPELSDLAEQIPERAVDAELEIVRVRSHVREALGKSDALESIKVEVKSVVHRIKLFNYLSEDLGNIIQRCHKR